MEQQNKELLFDGLKTLGIDEAQAKTEILSSYADILIETNGKFNLLGNVTESDIVVKHILDSVSGIKYIGNVEKVLDIGTGAGFPGFPLAVCLPHIKFTLADATEKKIDFIAKTAQALGVNNINAVCGRAEEMAHTKMRESFDVCTSRAVASLNKLCEYCLPFIKCGGHLAAYKGPLVYDEANEAEHAFSMLGGKLECIRIVSVPYLEGERYIAIVSKVKPTIEIYPRKNAQIIKKPL